MLHTITNTIIHDLSLSQSQGDRFAKVFAARDANMIAEIKIASPKYDMRGHINIGVYIDYICTLPHHHAISILINEQYFAGDITRITQVKQHNKLALFKEFVTCTRQIDGASYYGYDAILLIAKILTYKQMEEFAIYAQAKNIYTIIEVDNEEDLVYILPLVAHQFMRGIAINARNLDTMEIDHDKHINLGTKYFANQDIYTTFAFSGIQIDTNIDIYKGLYNGVLIGTSLIQKYTDSHT